MLAMPCSSAGEAQLPAAEALEVQAANKNDPVLMSYLNFLKLYSLQSPLMSYFSRTGVTGSIPALGSFCK